MMFLRDKDKPAVAEMLFNGSVVAAILAFVGALGIDLYLASTQWMLVAVLLAVWGAFLLVEAHFRLSH